MEIFLKIYKFLLKVYVSIFIGVLVLVIGVMIPELLIRLPEQPDVRYALGKITPHMVLEDLQRLLRDNGTCEVVYNCGNDSNWPEATAMLWTKYPLATQQREPRFDWRCYLRFKVRGVNWINQFDFYYDIDRSLCAIFLHRSSPFLEGNPTPWEWKPFLPVLSNSTYRCELIGELQ